MSQNTVRRVAIIGGNRIPFARSNGVYFTASNTDMFTAALNGLVERFNLQGQRLGEVVAGAVLKHSRDFNMTRECVLKHCPCTRNTCLRYSTSMWYWLTGSILSCQQNRTGPN